MVKEAKKWILPAGIYPDPQGGGVITPPSFHATPPKHLKFKGGVYGGGVYVIVMEWVINVVKY